MSGFPAPMEYTPGCKPPAYSDDTKPFTPLGLPGLDDGQAKSTLTSHDLVLDHQGLFLIGMSIKEIENCKTVFDGLVTGIER